MTLGRFEQRYDETCIGWNRRVRLTPLFLPLCWRFEVRVTGSTGKEFGTTTDSWQGKRSPQEESPCKERNYDRE